MLLVLAYLLFFLFLNYLIDQSFWMIHFWQTLRRNQVKKLTKTTRVESILKLTWILEFL